MINKGKLSYKSEDSAIKWAKQTLEAVYSQRIIRFRESALNQKTNMTALKRIVCYLIIIRTQRLPLFLRLEQMSSSVTFILYLKLQEKFLSDIIGHREKPFCMDFGQYLFGGYFSNYNAIKTKIGTM